MKTNLHTNKKEKFTFFYRSASPFSNWYPTYFKVDSIEFSSTEQYMMYQKAILFNDLEIAQKILDTPSPKQQKAYGRLVKNFHGNIWNEKCKQIVYDGCKAKFTQNENLLKHLLSTGTTTLVEASPRDTIWGIGLSENNPKAHNRHTWRGKNWLGEILTRLRNDLNTQ